MEKTDNYNLSRFIEAQDCYGAYDMALKELKAGRKRSHWVWFVFPQLKGLGHSYNSRFYGMGSKEESKACLENDILRKRLVAVCCELKKQVKENGFTVHQILGGIDAMKVKSCLTLFNEVLPTDIFDDCLKVCYNGEKDKRTLSLSQD